MGDPNTQAASKLPDRFGNYTILQHLATGGMAEVYLARQSGLEGFEKTVVIKRVRPELMSDRDITGSFLDEARLVATLQHPNIAQVTEIGLVNNTYFLVMEYVDGADLRELMYRAVEQGQRVAVADAIYILIQACVALHYAHEKRGPDGARLDIIHRDVTPSNVLLSHDGAVKVCDFGIAKATNRTTETVNGVLKGKYAYMSPEQCKCIALDRRSDIFALGILLYELSTLTRPFTSDNDFELLRTIIETPPPLPSSRVPHYPRDLERIVLRALAKDPDARYPTAQAMQLDLEALAREHKLSLSPINIARLMADLFNDSADTHLRQRNSAPDYEPLLETAARTLGKRPSAPPAELAAAPPQPTAPSRSVDSFPTTSVFASPIPSAQPPLSASLPDPPTRVPAGRAAPAIATSIAPTQLPLSPAPGAPAQPPLTASTPNAPTQLPLTATSIAPTQLPLSPAPSAPAQPPLTASAPNAGADAALMTSTPSAPTYVPFGAPAVRLETPPRSVTNPAAVVDPANPSARPFPVAAPRGADPRAARPSALWLIAAVAAALLATGISIAGRFIDRAANAASAALLDADADRLATALDASMRSARLRANAIAATPVLRTAIDTNAATMKDLADREYAFSVAAGETLEIFQLARGSTISLLRLPDAAQPLEPIAGAAARIQLLAGQLLVIAGAPISTNSGVRGSLVVATRADLAAATRLLAQHALDASLRGRDLDVRLVDPRDAPPNAPPTARPDAPAGSLPGVARTIPLPITSELSTSELALVATPVATVTTWVAPARLAAIAVALLLVLCYLLSFRRVRLAT